MRIFVWFLLCVGLGLGAGCGAELNGGRCEPACEGGLTCVEGQCKRVGPACKSSDECQEDSYCADTGTCTGYADPMTINLMCQRLVPAGLLSPGVFCEWSAPDPGDPFPNHRQVLMTPLVMDFDLAGNRSGEFITTKPSIVITTYDALDGACGLGERGDGANFGILRILDGRTCKQQHLIETHVNGAVTPALGDLDGDGRAEIVTYSATGGVVAFKFDRAQGKWVTLWTSTNAAGTAPSNPFVGLCKWTGPALADLDDDGKPETIAEGIVYDSTGRLVDAASANIGAMAGVGQFAVVADIDKDGVPNLVGTTGSWSWDKANRRWQLVKSFPLAKGGNEFAAAGDLGTVSGTTLDRSARDGLAEVVVVSAGELWVLSHTGELVFGKKTLPGAAGGGPPTIGDFDNDGRPEFAVAGKSSYTVYDPDCTAGAMPMFCSTGRTDGVLWSQASQDVSSNITGSSLFDFEGNGTVEAVYADECFARIYDGGTGEVLFSQQHSSCTWLEYPVVADIQGSFRSKLIVPSNENCPDIKCPAVDPIFKGLRCNAAADCPNGMPCTAGFCRCTADAQCNSSSSGGGFVCRDPDAMHMVPPGGQVCRAAFTKKRSGVRVFGDVLDRWVASRPTWNQHPYSISNVGDAGIIPRTSGWRRNWDQAGFNNFRQNVQGMFSPQSAPDTTAQGSGAGTGSCAGAMVTLSTNLCNRGTAPVGDGVPVSFYEGGTLLCTGVSQGVVLAGQCLKVSCSYGGAMSGEHEVTVVADDDGKGGGATSECIESNNRASFRYSCG
jgi:hypothetical protein